MSGLLATLERELRAYFYSTMAYVVLFFFLVANGISFTIIVSYLNDPTTVGSATPFEFFFGGFFFWMVLLFITPILTMRLLAEERKSGTIESLMTTPITEIEVVVGKYLAALAFYVFLWLPTLGYVIIISRSSALDWGPIWAGYVGVLGIGAVFLAAGVFASSFARNQIVAAIATFAVLFILFVVTFMDSLVTSELLKSAFGYMNLLGHMNEFSRGVVDTRRLVYYVSTVALFLFLSARTLEAKKWR